MIDKMEVTDDFRLSCFSLGKSNIKDVSCFPCQEKTREENNIYEFAFS
jgi:hypothetical protein